MTLAPLPGIDSAEPSTPEPDQAAIIGSLRRPAAFGPGCRSVDLVETHISYVFLTGSHAYKVKKAVRLPFLDFSTLAARRRFCELEVTLNRRTAPSLYLDVVPIVRRGQALEVGGAGDAVEWAVRMREFAQDALLSRLLEHGELTRGHVDRLAERVGAFHDSVTERTPPGACGRPHEVLRLAADNFDELAPLALDPATRARLQALRAWTLREHAARETLIDERARTGFVRACHGDLHLDNIVLVDGEPQPFDCIEFNPALRWCDVIADVAYTAMDLRARGRADLARRFTNRYLDVTGDYAGAALLRYYIVYRAVVRAKVAYLRAAQEARAPDADTDRRRAASYLDVAHAMTRERPRTIVAMHGLSGCGKTRTSESLLEEADVIRIRMDVERKRLAGLAASARSGSGIDDGLYSTASSRAAYRHVAASAEAIVAAGQPVVVDAAFLERWQRDLFRDLARRCDARFLLLRLVAPEAVLRERVAVRSASGADASEADVAVLERQLATYEPLDADELASAVTFSTERPGMPKGQRWRSLVELIRAQVE